MSTILFIILILILIGGIPSLGFHNYGWAPSGGVGLVLLILLILLLFGRL